MLFLRKDTVVLEYRMNINSQPLLIHQTNLSHRSTEDICSSIHLCKIIWRARTTIFLLGKIYRLLILQSRDGNALGWSLEQLISHNQVELVRIS